MKAHELVARFAAAVGRPEPMAAARAELEELKGNIAEVDDALRYHKVAATLEPTIEAHGDGRRRATLHARGKAVGYMAARSHDLVDIMACPILVPALQERAPALTQTRTVRS